ncbi:MAG: hypothetical protein LQ343_004369 [Gyalolechia ehrenbergii]|nr:MAG: hypothetical protein LQ343_004369 [Gyalolechia ehrenbergii]
MAAALSALNAKIRSHPYLSYFCSTHFWGPASNFGIPLAAIADFQKDPEFYGGREEALKMKAKAQESIQTAEKEGKNIIQQGEEKLKEVKDKVAK